MRSLLCGILLVLIAGISFSGTKKVIFIHHQTEHTPANIVANLSYIETLPFDGISIQADPAAHNIMSPNSALTYASIYDNNLKLVQGIFKKFTDNYAVVFVSKPGDFFNDKAWNVVVNNWRLFARAAKAAGLKGIVFDNEAYSLQLLNYPANVDSSSKYTLQQYRDQARLRGKQIMTACVEEFPDIKIMSYHGPYVSEPKFTLMNQGMINLVGAFFTGMVEGSGTSGYNISGGEVYGLRTVAEFESHYQWVKYTIASAANNSPNIPTALRADWSNKVGISFGTYNTTYPAGVTMNPTILRTTLENALRRCDDFVWFYVNWSEIWLTPPGTTAQQPWLAAISGAKAAVNSGIYLTCPTQASVQMGSNFSFTITFDNFTGAAASLTYVKKPSWVSANGNATLTGTAPNVPSQDTVTVVVSAGGKSDTLNLAIMTSAYYMLEAESGNLVAPMQIGSDPLASKGQYISIPAGTGNTISPKIEATYSVNIPTTGAYYVWLRIYKQLINPSGNYGTFVGFNGTFGKPGIANRSAGQYEWVIGSPVFNLTAGSNQLILGHGNEQVRIDKIIITNSPLAQLPLNLTSSLPGEKKGSIQNKNNLSIRIMPNGSMEFLGGMAGSEISIRDILGREMGFGQEIKSGVWVWNPKNGNSRICNGTYFVLLQQKQEAKSEIKKFTLAK